MQTLLGKKEKRDSETTKSVSKTSTQSGAQTVKTAEQKKKEEQQEFVMLLYDRVHTQSSML